MTNPKHPRTASAVILAIEIEQTISRGEVSFCVVASRPGRDGTFSREWTRGTGSISSSQANDLVAWIGQTAWNALIAWGGVQEELDAR